MKRNFFKMILPAAVVAFATFGAISTNAMSNEKAKLVDRNGYTHITGQPCSLSIMCSTNVGPLCKDVDGNQLYDFVSTTSCPNTLNKRQ